MKTHVYKTRENKNTADTSALSRGQFGKEPAFRLADAGPETVAKGSLPDRLTTSNRVAQLKADQEVVNHSPQVMQLKAYQEKANHYASEPGRKKRNNTGLPDDLKSNMENLSGYSMDDVTVKYNSDKPAQLLSHAYTKGTDIHVGPGQEAHLPHEAWHVVQQKQGRVKSTGRMNGTVNMNDDTGLEKEADAMGQKALHRTARSGAHLSVDAMPAASDGGQAPHSVIQRVRTGEISADKVDVKQLFYGLKSYGCKLTWGERESCLKRLDEAKEEIDSYPKAVLFLFPDQEEAVEAAKQEISDREEKARVKAEEERQEKSLETRYPAGKLGTYYRGDNRPLKKLSDGFQGFKVLKVSEARQMAQKWFGEGDGPEAYHQDWISNKTGGDKIATGNDIGCMGYGVVGIKGAQRNVYKISVPGMREVEPTQDVLGVTPNPKQKPKLLLNAARLKDATIIAVGGARAEETTFFTSLPLGWVELVYEHTGDDEQAGKGRGWVKPL